MVVRGSVAVLALGVGMIVGSQPASAGAEYRSRTPVYENDGTSPGSTAADRTGVTRSGVRVTIDFDTGDAPCAFSRTQPLTDEFAFVGVHFRGLNRGIGGAMLNQCGDFGVQARSGAQFLAFNSDLDYPRLPERLIFDRLQTRVAMYVANGDPGRSTYWLVAKRDGAVVATTSIVSSLAGYTAISLAVPEGFDRVLLKAGPDNSYVVDDVTFVPKG